MPDLNTPERLLIRRQEAAARPRKAQPDRSWPASQFHDPHHTPRVRVPSKRVVPPGKPTHIVTARSAMKVVAVLDPEEVADLVVPDGKPRLVLTIRLPDRTVTADLDAKSVRRATTMVREQEPTKCDGGLRSWLANWSQDRACYTTRRSV